mgnify:CR=1 FL=1
MINKLKISVLITFLTLTFVSVASAADLVFNNDTTVTIGSANYTIASGSTATSIAPGTSSITIIMPDNATLTFKSPDRYALTNTYGVVFCGSSFSSVTIERFGTFTITPDTSTVCTNTRLGGGGGDPYPPPKPTIPAVPVTPAVPATSETSAIPAVPATPATPTYNFGTVTLKRGSKGEPVKELQRFLNDKLNLGLKLDGKLGPKTIAVIKKWQKANGLKADGLVGVKTKAKMNAMVK